MTKNKKKKRIKGFTLIEITVVVLIIGVLASMMLPVYKRAVEKSRASEPMSKLSSIAKAQNIHKYSAAHYTDEVGNLDISLKDKNNGESVMGDSFESEYFTYKVYGDEESAAVAKRRTNNEEDIYEISVDYETGKLFCSPEGHPICIALGLEVGRDFVKWPQEEDCDPTVYEYSNGVRYNRGQFYCKRSLFKDGTKEERVCSNANDQCRIFNNEGKKINQLNKVGNTWQIYTYDPNTSQETSRYTYQNGLLKSYNIYENGRTVESYSRYSSSSLLNYYDEGSGNYWQSQFNASGTPQYTLHFENGTQVSSQKYNSSGQITSVDFLEASGARATVLYNDNGSIRYSRCYSGDCDNWEAPERSSLKYGTTGISLPPTTEYCVDNPNEDFFCGS